MINIAAVIYTRDEALDRLSGLLRVPCAMIPGKATRNERERKKASGLYHILGRAFEKKVSVLHLIYIRAKNKTTPVRCFVIMLRSGSA